MKLKRRGTAFSSVQGDAAKVLEQADKLCAPVPSGHADDEQLHVFIASGVLRAVLDVKGADRADEFVKFAALLVRCCHLRPGLWPLAIGAVADALAPDKPTKAASDDYESWCRGAGSVVAPSPSLPWGGLASLDEQA